MTRTNHCDCNRPGYPSGRWTFRSSRERNHREANPPVAAGVLRPNWDRNRREVAPSAVVGCPCPLENSETRTNPCDRNLPPRCRGRRWTFRSHNRDRNHHREANTPVAVARFLRPSCERNRLEARPAYTDVPPPPLHHFPPPPSRPPHPRATRGRSRPPLRHLPRASRGYFPPPLPPQTAGGGGGDRHRRCTRRPPTGNRSSACTCLCPWSRWPLLVATWMPTLTPRACICLCPWSRWPLPVPMRMPTLTPRPTSTPPRRTPSREFSAALVENGVSAVPRASGATSSAGELPR